MGEVNALNLFSQNNYRPASEKFYSRANDIELFPINKRGSSFGNPRIDLHEALINLNHNASDTFIAPKLA